MTDTWRLRLAGGGMVLCLAHGVALAQGKVLSFVQPSADVSASIQANTTPVARAGQLVDYMLVVGNAGPSVATGVRVNLSSANLTNAQVSGACSALPCMIDTLGVGYYARIHVHMTVAADGPFTLSAGVIARQNDPNKANNSGDVTVELPPAPPKPEGGTADVSVSIQPRGQPLARPGQRADYRLVVGNAGPSVATGVSVNFKSANLANAQVSGACAQLPCTIGALSVGAKVSIFLHQTVVADAPFSLLAGAVPSQTDPNPANNTDMVTVNPGHGGDHRLWWFLLGGGSLLALVLGTKAAMDGRGRARWLRQLSLSAHRGFDDAYAPGPLSFAAPALRVTVRCGAGEAGPKGSVPVLKVVSDD